MIALTGGALTLAASFLFYLASPNRKIARQFMGPGLVKLGGALGVAAGLVLLLWHYAPATAVFIWATLAMLVLSIAPLAIAWWKGMPEDRT